MPDEFITTVTLYVPDFVPQSSNILVFSSYGSEFILSISEDNKAKVKAVGDQSYSEWLHNEYDEAKHQYCYSRYDAFLSEQKDSDY